MDHTVVKYANRKYYSLKIKKYINLDQISTITPVRVVDHGTGFDITQETLLRARHRKEMLDMLRAQV